MTKRTIKDRLVPEAFRLASEAAHDLACQDQFAQLYLDTDQRKEFAALCLAVRECRAGNKQQILDAVAKIIERR